jgi:hypothetical protein
MWLVWMACLLVWNLYHSANSCNQSKTSIGGLVLKVDRR